MLLRMALGSSRMRSSVPGSASSSFRVWEYGTLILFLVLGSCYSYLYLKSIYFFSRVYSKGRFRVWGVQGLGFGVVGGG